MSTDGFEELLQNVRRRLQEARESPPGEIKSEAYLIEKSVVQLRDYLIGRFRSDAGKHPNIKESLDTVNMALSLVVGLEFPLSGMKKQLFDEALHLLDNVRAV